MYDLKRRHFFNKFSLTFLSIPFLEAWKWPSKGNRESPGVFFTTGFKISEVTDRSVNIWTRLCADEYPNPIRHRRRDQVFRHPIDFDEKQPVGTMDGAVKASSGWVRVKISNESQEFDSGWLSADESADCTIQAHFPGLTPGTKYRVDVEGRRQMDSPSTTETGTFQTAPVPGATTPVLLTTSTCQYFWSFDDEKRGFKTYDAMRTLQPDFFVHTGDYVYYDKPGPLARNVEQARHKWHAMDSWLSIRDFYREVPMFMIKDDHDLLKDDAFPGMEAYGDLTFEDGLKVWYENAPIQNKPYRRIRWGKDLELWLVEGREFRSPNTAPDGHDKSIWGEEQKEWFVSTVNESDATFKILFTATPVVGPDRDSKKDNHANAVFNHEGKWLREYLAGHQNFFVVNGDRHWQYVSKDVGTGVMEFGSGPVSDFHAQGWKEDDVRPQHRFLRVKGGFLSIRVYREIGQPTIVFDHRDVNGNVMHTETFSG